MIERSKPADKKDKQEFDLKTGEVSEPFKRTLETMTKKDWKDIEKKITDANRDGIRSEATVARTIEEYEIEQEELRKEIRKLVSSVYEADKKYHGFNKKHIVQKVEIVIKEQYPSLIRNDLSGAIEIDDVPAAETDLNSIRLDLNILGHNIKKEVFYDIMFSKFIPNYHPLQEYFESNKDKYFYGYGPMEKDDKRIPCTGNMAKLAAAIISNEEDGSTVFDERYNEHFVTRWMAAAVSGVFGYVNPLVLILIGERQNTGKTHFFRNLFPDYLKRFFAETKLDDMKESDLAMKMNENLFLFDDEMSGRTKQDQKRLKYLTSVSEFTIRKPYKRTMEKVKRLASLCGTSNDMYLIADPTGNRRLVPLHVVKIDHEKYNEIDKGALWFEAYHLFRLWEHSRGWELRKEDITFLGENTACFQSVDKDLELLMHCFEVPQPGAWDGVADLTASQIASHIEFHTRQRVDPKNLGIRLKKLGIHQKKTNREGLSVRLYTIKYRNPINEGNNNPKNPYGQTSTPTQEKAPF